MKLHELPPKQREAWEKVTQYLKENPDATSTQAFEATGTHQSNYSQAKRKLAGKPLPPSLQARRKSKPKKTYNRIMIPVDETPLATETKKDTGKLLLLYGSPADVGAAISGLIRG